MTITVEIEIGNRKKVIDIEFKEICQKYFKGCCKNDLKSYEYCKKHFFNENTHTYTNRTEISHIKQKFLKK